MNQAYMGFSKLVKTILGNVITSRVAKFGSNWDNGSYTGVFNLNLNNAASNSNTNIGARQMYLKLQIIWSIIS